MRSLRISLACAVVAAATPVAAQEGYVEVRGIADFVIGPDSFADTGFTLYSYAVEAGFNGMANAFSPQFFYFTVNGVWDGFGNNVGNHAFSGGLSFTMPGIISFGLPEHVVLFIDNEARTFSGTTPLYPALLMTAEGPVGWSNVRDVSLTLNFRDDAPIPEPSTWLLMIAGFGLVGLSARRRRLLAA